MIMTMIISVCLLKGFVRLSLALSPRSSENSKMQWHKLLVAQHFHHITQPNPMQHAHFYTGNGVHNSASFKPRRDWLRASMKFGVRDARDGVEPAMQMIRSVMRHTEAETPSRSATFAYTCDSKRKWQVLPRDPTLRSSRRALKSTNLAAPVDYRQCHVQ